MKISVNKAIKYRNKIAALVALGNPVPTVIQVIATDNKTVINAFEAGNVAYYKGMETAANAVRVLFELRDLIADANIKSGASKVISAIAAIEAQIALFEKSGYKPDPYNRTPVNDVESVVSAIEYRERLEKIDPTKITQPGRATILVVTEKDINDTKELIRNLKLEVETLTEKRNEINYSHVVELPDSIVDFLKGEKLI